MNIETWIKIWRAGFIVSFFGVTQFVLCCIIAMAQYPGGTMLDSTTTGYDLSENYLSDLGREVALNNEPNPGRFLFNGSLVLLGICSLPFFMFMPTHAYDRTGWLILSAVIGTFAAVAIICLGSYPCDLSPIAHFVALFVWLVAIFFASSIHAIALLTSKETTSMFVSLVSVGVAMLAVAYLYNGTETVAAVVMHREIPLKAVLLQKLLGLATLIWIFTISLKLLLTADFSEFYPREVGEDSESYLQSLEEDPWLPQRR